MFVFVKYNLNKINQNLVSVFTIGLNVVCHHIFTREKIITDTYVINQGLSFDFGLTCFGMVFVTFDKNNKR